MIIAGLGNPGNEYENTPHNAGFEALDFFAQKKEFPPFKLDRYSNSLVSKKNDVVLAKPQTFMNESGLALKKLAGSRPVLDLIVIHDDIDLPLGEFKISVNRGSAGHKGVESIMKALGTENFTRIRIGASKQRKPDVLKKFGKKDKEILKKVFEQVSLEIEKLSNKEGEII